jgi:hypothetical protein
MQEIKILSNNYLIQQQLLFFISNFRRVLNVVLFILGDSQASEFYVPTFRNTLPVPSS